MADAEFDSQALPPFDSRAGSRMASPKRSEGLPRRSREPAKAGKKKTRAAIRHARGTQ